MVNSSYTYSKWMSNNDASLGEGGTGQSSQRPQSMFDYEAEWSRSQFDRPHRLALSYIWESRARGPAFSARSRRVAAVGYHVGAVGPAVHDHDGRRLERGLERRFPTGRTSTRPARSYGTITRRIHEQRLLRRAARFEQPAAEFRPRHGNAPRNRAQRVAGTPNSALQTHRLPGPTRTVRFDVFNVFNQDSYGNPISSIEHNFGKNTNNWGRRILQLSGKLTF